MGNSTSAQSLSLPQLPIDTIEQFVTEVKKLIENIVNYWDQLLVPVDFRQQLKDAWKELQPKLANWDLADTQAMTDAGLNSNSAQLKLKLGILNGIWDKFAKFGASWLDDLLDAINDVLGSIPGAEALEELKKAIENLIQFARRDGN